MHLHFQGKAIKLLEITALAGVVLLFYGFFFNRVANNLGSILIGIYTLAKINDNRKLFLQPWMLSFIFISVIPLLSDIIMEGFEFYKHRGIMKLLLILYPAFFFCLKPDIQVLQRFMLGFIILMFFSSCFSLFYYFKDYDDMFITYKQSRVVRTLSLGDHIRISWATVVSCVMALYYIYNCSSGGKKNVALWIYIVFQILFLHILGSKTGLIILYITAALFLIYRFNFVNKWVVVFLIFLTGLLPYMAYKTIPSFEQRVNFVKYDFEHYSKGLYREGLSDAIRFYSLKAGKAIINEHPWFGVGFSRLQNQTNEWFKKQMPQISKESYFLPSSQIVIYWAAGGVFCLLVFLFHLLYPFFEVKLRGNKWFMMFFIPAALSFTYETHLEGQLPLFFYGFIVSFFWYLGLKPKNLK